MILQIFILTVQPVQQNLFLFVGVCEIDEFAFENDYPVLFFSRCFGYEIVDVLEHAAIKRAALFFGSVMVDSSVDKVKLVLKNTVR
jgi:hypothetical protein